MKEKGFTLAELAIVLMVIGLLLGGTLRGQELVAQARIKRAIADFNSVSAAYHGYRDRYRALPGDDLAAGRWAGAAAGDGNGVVEGAYNAASGTPKPESRLWWEHLRRARFIDGAIDANQPMNFRQGLIGVQTGDAAGGTTLGGFAALLVCSNNLPDKIAAAVDAQVDDGVAATGSTRAQLQAALNPPVDAASFPAVYVETGANLYTLCRELR